MAHPHIPPPPAPPEWEAVVWQHDARALRHATHMLGSRHEKTKGRRVVVAPCADVGTHGGHCDPKGQRLGTCVDQSAPYLGGGGPENRQTVLQNLKT